MSKSTTSSLLQIGLTVTGRNLVTLDEALPNKSVFKVLRATGWAIVLVSLVLAGLAVANYFSSANSNGAVHEYEAQTKSYATCLNDLEILRAGGTVQHEAFPGISITESKQYVSIDSDFGVHINYPVIGQRGCFVPVRPWLDYFEWYYPVAAMLLGTALVGYANARSRKPQREE